MKDNDPRLALPHSRKKPSNDKTREVQFEHKILSHVVRLKLSCSHFALSLPPWLSMSVSVHLAATVALISRWWQQNIKDNPACNTLFVGNLGVGTSEGEIRTLFSSFYGFRQLKILRSSHGTICFVEYQDIPTASYVHSVMQGAVPASSDRGGMRIQFSKNAFGCRSAEIVKGVRGDTSQALRAGGKSHGGYVADGVRVGAVEQVRGSLPLPLEVTLLGPSGQELESEIQSHEGGSVMSEDFSGLEVR